ncbi:phosphatidate cytidylyltransferase [Enemella evansiae]|uniref:Phosphatidate cytidylyltransferase n=1 Tax=Enemella evansiae TaxID=2016499 RepID=A0A255GFB6_9ACTN|nr:phosphatidate cytidylyltransferase [Enemella evansiae]PFG67734.1 phosphatidate cytidylyltransferase [Propionibacteriaceae bacterium ES.041]OYN92921.1 phosphatidate cytidylyltransferase [Enemella evansiae]OYN94661.1 phosphatidate cytidylyltransferase [Enemella evansiae]OYO04243.1 phosphatidate cytidylyltransferase [Enemella evansiae]OYO07067.1 phosphatidate cytidylyltransferase [Enemella evansiae]
MTTSEPGAREPQTPIPGEGGAPRNHGRAGRNLPAAIGVGVVLGAALVLTLGWWPPGFVLLVAAFLALGAMEVHQALKRLDMHSAILPILVGTVSIVTGSYFASSQQPVEIPTNTLMLAMIGITALVCMIWRMFAGEQGYVRDVAASMLIIGYIPLQGSFVGLMLGDQMGRARVITFIAVVAFGDIGGYVFGILIGRHKMAPRISPKKTWEGFAGSLVFGTAAAVLMTTLVLKAPWWVGVILGVVLVVVGACGDLIESLIKRDIGIKDMSSILPGHGGVMDRLDSLLVAAPAAWLLMFLLIPGVR